MISVQEATTIIQSHPSSYATESVSFVQSTGRILAEEVYADQPFPPFDRVMMDGIAISYTSWISGNRSFPIQEVQPAGVPKSTLADNSHCIEVMTGAVLPDNTDTVIPYEELSIKNGIALVALDAIAQWKNIHKCGTDQRQGDLLLERGRFISPAEVATLAAVGKSDVLVIRQPKIAIISTGDELVEVHQTPASHQVRKSNSYALKSALDEMKVLSNLIHLPDQREEIIDQLKSITADYDTIILSGGVSKGKKDYVPEALQAIGVEKLFHRVRQRPGKPFWFGRKEDTTIFALPGNPVSTFLCFYKYIKPWLSTPNEGEQAPLPTCAALNANFEFTPPLTYFMQVKVSNENGVLMATPVPGGGSGDLTNLNLADGFLELPDDKTIFKKGEVYPYFSFR